MKKYIMLSGLLFTMVILMVVGCDFDTNNTPTKQVELFLADYQTLNKDVMDDLHQVIIEDATFNEKQQDRYKELMKKHYQNLTYDIMEEKIDGDEATVVTQIEVTDYTKANSKASVYRENHKEEFYNENGKYDATLFYDYILDQFEKVKDKVTYTINFKVKQNSSGKWKLEPLTEEQEKKIHGVYEY